MQESIYDVVIIGGGPAGLTAAVYTSRAFLKTLVIAGNPSGGQLMLTSEVENFPAFPQGILGPELIGKIREQAQKFETKFVDENVIQISGTAAIDFEVKTSDSHIFKAKSVIVATGASAKWLGLENEQRLRGKGVSACATCDGFFFRDKVVAVVGGGDASMEEANFLTKFATKVYVLVRGSQDEMKASKIMQARALHNPKIEFLFNTQVLDVLGTDFVSGLRILNTLTKQESNLDSIQGLFVAIGHKPNTDFLKDFVELDHVGYIKVSDVTHSSQPGIFVAGDVADFRYRQAITASGLGCMASLDVIKFLAEKGVEVKTPQY